MAGETGKDWAPLGPAEFDRLMRVVGPFERSPRLAVAVSGGSDSMTLALLAADWTRRRRGEITILTVDHGLRPESAVEARQVGRWLKAHYIRHRILRWQPPDGALAGGVQAAARDARYELLTAWCRARGVLHLALAHQQEDQAETLLLRLARGSGLDGLAAMAPIAERDGVRIVRPLLPIPRARLGATLERRGQPWIDDPSNENPAHARVRLRRLMPALAAEGFAAQRLAATADHLARARAAIDDAVSALLAEAAALFPAGYVRLDPQAFASAPAEVSLRALARCLVTVGGGGYGPRHERLIRLHEALRHGKLAGGATLGGCRILPWRRTWLICREPAMAVEAVAIAPDASVRWDGRFAVQLVGAGRAEGNRGFKVRRLGADGWAALAAVNMDLRRHTIPPAVRPALPAVWGRFGVAAVPHLDFARPSLHMTCSALFVPGRPLAGARFA